MVCANSLVLIVLGDMSARPIAIQLKYLKISYSYIKRSNGSKFTRRRENGHYFGKIGNIMHVLHFNKIDFYVNTIEEFHNYKML